MGPDAPRRVARQRDGIPLVHVARAEEGRATAPNAPDRRGRPRSARPERRRLPAAEDRAGYPRRPARRGSLALDRTDGRRGASRPRDDVPDRPRVSTNRRVRRVVRPHADTARRSTRDDTSLRMPPARADGGAAVPALASARHLQQRLHEPRQPRRLLRRRPLGRTAPARAGHDRRLPERARRRLHLARWRDSRPDGRARPAEPAVDRRPRPAKSPAQDNSLWGSTLGNAVRVWRSGAGIDRHGNLIYLAAEDQTAASLAVAS